MGDHRFSFKAKFEIYGKTFDSGDWWLNWSADDGEIDRRITDWILDCYTKARANRDAEMYEAERASREAEVEASERAELKRLMNKYGGGQ